MDRKLRPSTLLITINNNIIINSSNCLDRQYSYSEVHLYFYFGQVQAEMEEIYFQALEKKERLENQMASIREKKCKVVSCKKVRRE